MERNSTIRLVVVGYLSLRPEFERFSSRITRFDFVADLDEYWPLIAAADINLAVLSPGVMSDCKSEIKWLEAAILQVPSVVSGTATYKEILEDGVDALIVEDHAAWAAALDRLIEDYDLRCSIGAAARRKALQLYSIESGAELLRKELDVTKASGRDVIPSKDMRRQDGNSKMKVLVCHIFFTPQSYGGATRVVQDNVDYIKDQCPDIELSIFATDEGISSPGHFRFDAPPFLEQKSAHQIFVELCHFIGSTLSSDQHLSSNAIPVYLSKSQLSQIIHDPTKDRGRRGVRVPHPYFF
jgi:hypothetical protein